MGWIGYAAFSDATESRKARGDEYKNLTKNLVINSPFQVISSDISYIRTGEGFDYLCQIREAIFEYTEVFYSRCRVQKRLGYQSPLTFLNAWQQLHLQSVALQIVRKTVDFSL